ncbi:DUF2189 domain-containing protein [Falsiroseomonas sp. CW058]|uniref:DUF2189 domain-containing protein n=1 Tax=Falsiroseomonas sp. CW058 TaxID=3388664 RepID=UPI003D3101CD
MNIDAIPAPAPAAVRIHHVAPDRPWTWLAAGWRDLMAAPHVGFFYGAAVVAAGWVVVIMLLQMGAAWAVLPATAGFFLIAPLLGAGIYETSRRRERGEDASLPAAFAAFRRNGPQLALMGALLTIIHLFWVRMAGLLFAVFFGLGFSPAIETLPTALLRSDHLLPFLVIGTGIGFVLATAAFAVSAVSIPMLVDRDITAMEAVMVSMKATAENWRAMAFWAGLIVVFTAMALVPFFLGLALVLPLVGHATWHAYRDLVR